MRFRLFLTAFLFAAAGSTGNPETALALEAHLPLPAPVIMKTELKPAGTPYTFEIITGTAEGEEQLSDLAEWIARDLRTEEAKNPRLLSIISSLETLDDGRSPQGEGDSPRPWRTAFREFTDRIATSKTRTAVENAPANFKNWYGVPANKLRLNFSLIKGSFNGGLQFYTLLHASDHIEPFWHAVGVGTTVGLLCGGLSFASPWMNKMLGEATWVKNYLQLKNRYALKSAEFLENTAKFFLIEVGFLGVVKITSALLAWKLGMNSVDHVTVMSILAATLPVAGAIAVKGFWSTLSQGIFDIGVSREHMRDALAASQLTEDAAAKALARVEFKSQLLKAVSSGLSVYGALAEGQASTVALGSLASLGILNMARVYRADIIEATKSFRKKVQSRCQRLLERMSYRTQLGHLA